MSKEKNNKDLDLQDNKYSQLTKENEIIEEIINNPLLLKDIEDLEEDEEEDSYSEKDKITEEILDNKLSFIIPEENESKQNENKNYIKRNSQKIHKDIIENLLIELFEYHYNDISTEKKMNLGNKILESKYHIGFFCVKLNKNFSKYILLILEQKIYELIEHVEKLIKTKVKSVKDILEIKNSLKLTGHDIEKIFEKPFQKIKQSFDISSVLIVLFISDILNDNKINLTDDEYEEIIQAVSYEEKDRFEKYIEECKLLFEKIESGENENDEDIEVYEEEKQNENENEIENNDEINDIDNNNITNDEKENEKEIKNIKNGEIKDNKMKKSEEKKDIYIIEDIINKNKNNKIINSINNENIIKNSNDNNKNIINNINNDKNNIDNKAEKYSNIEDLVNYINGSDKKKKKKKKRKKKTKVSNSKIIEEEKENDDVFENFKMNLIKFSDSLQNVKKIKPKISDAFLEKLKLIN